MKKKCIKDPWIAMCWKFTRSLIDNDELFGANGKFKYMMKTSKNNDEDADVMTRIHIKRQHRCPLQVHRSKVKDAKVRKLLSDEWEAVVSVALRPQSQPNNFFGEGILFFSLERSLLQSTYGGHVATLRVTSFIAFGRGRLRSRLGLYSIIKGLISLHGKVNIFLSW